MTELLEKIQEEFKTGEIFNDSFVYAIDYLNNVFNDKVYPSSNALQNLSYFDESLPDVTGDSHSILSLLHRHGAPATVKSIGGRYFGFVVGSSLPVGLAAKALSTYWDQVPAMYVTSPLCSKLEVVVEGWLKEMFHLPPKTVAGFVSGTSLANYCGLAAARYSLLSNAGWNVNQQGLNGSPRLRIVTGNQAHSTVIKAITLLGFGIENIEFIATDQQGRIILESMPKLDERTIVILQAGNVNSGSFDPIDPICRIAKEAKAWVHIDGAFGLWAQACSSLNHLTVGLEKADSWAVDAHKTLNAPYDNGIVLCADPEALANALHLTGDYIHLGSERNCFLHTPEFSRRSRIIELWATMKYLGKEGVNQLVVNMHERAMQFQNEIEQIGGFHVLNKVVLNQVVVSCESDDVTIRTLKKIQELNECWVGGSIWNGKQVIRLSVCSWATTREDITRTVKSFEKALKLQLETQEN